MVMKSVLQKALIAILGLFVLIHIAQAAADEPPQEEKETHPQVTAKAAERSGAVALEEIVVTSTKTPKALWEVPAAVSVVTQEDLKRKNYLKLNEALEFLPGVSAFASRKLAEPFPGVNLRGFHGHMRTMVLVNGQPISPFLYNASLVPWSLVPVDIVERIEVVRGPFSALYGGDAVGGVINIITKCPPKLEALLRGGFGDRQTYKVHAGASNRFLDKINLYLSFDKRTTDSFVSDYCVVQPTAPGGGAIAVRGAIPQNWPSGGPAYLVGDLGRFFYDEITLNLSMHMDITDDSYFRFNALYSEYLIDPFNNHTYLRDNAGNPVYSGLVTFLINGNPVFLDLSPSDFLNYRIEKATGIYNAEYVNKINDKFDFKLTAGITNFSKDIFFIPIGNATMNGGSGLILEAPSNIVNSEIQVNYWLMPKFLLTGGFNYRYDFGRYSMALASNWKKRDSKTDFYRSLYPNSNRFGLYFQGEIHLLDNLVIYPGVRLDWWNSRATVTTTVTRNFSSHDDSLSPKLAIVYHPWEDTTLRLSGGKAFRVPNFFELYQIWRAGGQEYRPKPDLKPEITWGWEAGIEQRLFDKRTQIGLTYFEHYTTDYIDSRLFSSGGITYMQRDNIGKVQARGLEVELHQKIGEYVNFFTNYTYIDAVIKKYEGYPEYVNKTPRYVPQHMFNAGLDFHYDRYKASIITHYMSRMYYNNLNDTVNWNVYTVLDKVDFITDLTLGVDITKNINATITINNIFDKDNYYQYARQSGRSYFGVISIKY